MLDFIANIYNIDKQAFALFIQAIATIVIGILAWTAARGQNIIAEKSERKELFKLRFNNIYQETNLLFVKCIKLIDKYNDAKNIKSKKNRTNAIINVQNEYIDIKQNFYHAMNINKFLIRPKDYDRLISFCSQYLSHIDSYLFDKEINKICPNYQIAICFNEHYTMIPKILSSYLYYENECKFFFWLYKIIKYFKNHIKLFLLDYFPFICDVVSTILLSFCLLLGLIYTYFEYLKELLKATILIENGKIKLKLKMKSSYLKRNRPWPL